MRGSLPTTTTTAKNDDDTASTGGSCFALQRSGLCASSYAHLVQASVMGLGLRLLVVDFQHLHDNVHLGPGVRLLLVHLQVL